MRRPRSIGIEGIAAKAQVDRGQVLAHVGECIKSKTNQNLTSWVASNLCKLCRLVELSFSYPNPKCVQQATVPTLQWYLDLSHCEVLRSIVHTSANTVGQAH